MGDIWYSVNEQKKKMVLFLLFIAIVALSKSSPSRTSNVLTACINFSFSLSNLEDTQKTLTQPNPYPKQGQNGVVNSHQERFCTQACTSQVISPCLYLNTHTSIQNKEIKKKIATEMKYQYHTSN